jgi:hypothetical protein
MGISRDYTPPPLSLGTCVDTDVEAAMKRRHAASELFKEISDAIWCTRSRWWTPKLEGDEIVIYVDDVPIVVVKLSFRSPGWVDVTGGAGDNLQHHHKAFEAISDISARMTQHVLRVRERKENANQPA